MYSKLMYVLDIQDFAAEDRKVAFDHLSHLDMIQANDVGFKINFREFHYEEDGKLIRNVEDYDERYLLLFDVVKKYLPEEFWYSTIIFYVWW